jgi:hypothetical protein
MGTAITKTGAGEYKAVRAGEVAKVEREPGQG